MSENDISVNIVENPPIKVKITDEQQKTSIVLDSNIALSLASHNSNQSSHNNIIRTINQSIAEFVDEFRAEDTLLNGKIDLKLDSSIFNTFSSLVDEQILNLENNLLTVDNFIEGDNVILQKNGSDVTINVETKSNLNIFSANSGNVDSAGNADLLLNASNQLLFKIGNGENLNYKPLVITNINRKSFTIEDVNSIDISSYADGNYNVFASALSSSALALSALSVNLNLYNNTIYRQKKEPTKSINATKVGSPTVNNGIVSGFSSSDFLTLNDYLPSFGSNTWEWVTKANTGSLSGSLIGKTSGGGVSLVINTNGTLSFAATYDGTQWDLTQTSSLTVNANTNYYFKVEFTGSAYKVSVSTNGNSYTEYVSTASSTSIQTNLFNFSLGYTASGTAFAGTINLNESYIKLGNNIVWTGVTNMTNAIWLDTSGEPLSAKKYNGSTWETFNGVPLGNITIANSVITAVKTFPYNYNGIGRKLYDSYKNGTSWYNAFYQVNPSTNEIATWIEQGGIYYPSDETYTTTLLKSYSDTNYSILLTKGNGTSSYRVYEDSIASKYTSSFVVASYDYSYKWVVWETKGYGA